MELLHHFFEHQVEKTPDKIALVCNAMRLSYRDLELMSNQMAQFLQTKNVLSGDRVALLLPKTVDLYIAILATLKLGAAYVPIDPEYPNERIEYIIQNSTAKLLLTSSEYANKLTSIDCDIIYLNQAKELITQHSHMPVQSNITPNDLCYIIYTSGSTGRPKGVQITHQSICNYASVGKEIYHINADDRIYQGFSIAFDASIEEIWLAFASGATLVTGISSALHGGATLVEFLNLHEVTVFSTAPTLLSMLEGDVPSLRVLILGGEVCPPELIARWQRPQRLIFNTYGPTETTVVATYKECHAGEMITIGKPIPNCQVQILDEALNPVPAGRIGELYIGGIGLARGYTRDELTKEKFIYVPQLQQRFYRTADLGYFTENGEIQYVGRADDQVKLRGFRVELTEIEATLLCHPDILTAAVALHELVAGVQSLVGYIVLKGSKAIDTNALHDYMRQHLPDYMVPNIYEIVQNLPLLPSGKVDRKRLPKPSKQQGQISKDYVGPRNETEKLLATLWENLLNHAPISIQADFFHELGGHSLLAAKMVSQLRKHPGMENVSMLDLYENPSIAELANKIAAIQQNTIQSNQNPTTPNANVKVAWRYRLCAIGQAIGVYAQFAVMSGQFLLFYLILQNVFITNTVGWKYFVAFTLLWFGLYPGFFLLAVMTKWILLGRIKPGEYPLWGWFYFRWWFTKIIQGLAPLEYLTGSPLINLYYRMMGVKLGKNCYIGSASLESFDLISIGDNSSIGTEVSMAGSVVENGWLKIGTIKIGKNCFVGANSVLSINSELKDDSKLGEHSMLPEDNRVPAGESYCGSPARPGKVETFPEAMIKQKTNPVQQTKATIFKYSLLHLMALYYIMLVYTIAIVPGILLIDHIFFDSKINLLSGLLLAVPIGGILFVTLLCLLITISKKLVLRRAKPGIYSLRSSYFVRKWLMDKLIKLSQDTIGGIYATLYLPIWFRTLGAKIGRRTEISTVTHVSPDLLTIEDESFIADGVSLGAPLVYKNFINIAANKIGKRAFVGNGASVTQGIELGDHCLVGCLSVSPKEGEAAKEHTSWFGSPAVFLPRREIFEGFTEKETYVPTLSMYIKRGVLDFIRTVSPGIALFLLIYGQFFAMDLLTDHFSLLPVILLFALATMVIALGIGGIIIALKWLVMGKYRETVQPAWSSFVWRNELITGMYDFVMVPLLLDGLVGTPYIAVFLRMLGMKIGKKCFINTTYFTEFDLVHIDDYVALNAGSTIQTHLFEDRVMKMAKLRIMDHCRVGNMAIVLYDTLMEKGASLANLSLLMKGETLSTYSQWYGIPAQSPNRSQLTKPL